MATRVSRPRLRIRYAISPLPPVVTGITASGQPIRIKVTWDESTDGTVVGYEVWRKHQDDDDFTKVAEIGSFTYFDSEVLALNTYTYRVRAFDADGLFGPYSAEASAQALDFSPVTPATGTVKSIDFRWILAQSSDLTPIGELHRASARQLTVGLNRAGNTSIRLPIDDNLAAAASVLTTCIIVYYRDKPVWSGPVWTIEDSLPDDHRTINAVGWFEILNHRYTRQKLAYDASDAGLIAHELLRHANEAGFPIFIVPGSLVGSQVRKRSYDQLANIGQEIQALADVEAGYDWWIHPTDRTLNIAPDSGLNLVDKVAFAYGMGTQNLAAFNRQIDGSSLKNRIFVTGKNGAPFTSHDDASRSLYGTMESVESLSDVQDAAILGAYGQAEVLFYSVPFQSFALTPMPHDGQGRVPRLFVDYNIGDRIKFTARRGPINIRDQAVRVFGATLQIDENGIERVSNLQVTYEGG